MLLHSGAGSRLPTHWIVMVMNEVPKSMLRRAKPLLLVAAAVALAGCEASRNRTDENTATPQPNALRCPATAAAGTAVEPIVWSRYGKLTLPSDEDGKKGPDEIAAADFDGYSSAFFHRAKPGEVTAGGYRAGGGESVFWAPVDGGATTRNAKYVRSEFREQIELGSDRANWPLAGTHVMRGTALVSLLPTPLTADDNVKTVIAQIHGVETSPPIKLQVSGSDDGSATVYAIYNARPKAGDTSTSKKLKISLCTPIRYEIRVADGVMTTTVNDEVVDSRDLKAEWSAETFYFKAGNYVQNSTKNATGAGEVVYTALSISHQPP